MAMYDNVAAIAVAWSYLVQIGREDGGWRMEDSEDVRVPSSILDAPSSLARTVP
jgi:hypothetical protein